MVLAAEPAHTAALHQRDERVERAHARVLARLTEPSWPHGVEMAVDAALLARFYERYADHAVTSARHSTTPAPAPCPTPTNGS